MLAVISPAKTLDFETPAITPKFTVPEFAPQSAKLIKHLRQLAPQDISDLMGISAKLADLNYQRYAQWQQPFAPDNAKQALLAFKGDVYLGLKAQDYSERDFTWAQKHLRILSGLHGVLRPLDLMQPYRLEMGTRLEVKSGRQTTANLYEYWGAAVTDALNETFSDNNSPVLLNLASQEYFSVLQPEKLNARIITPTFLDLKNGKYKFLSFYAKKARGSMASYMIKNRITGAAKLKAFDVEGYRFCPERSAGDDWVFLRDTPPPTQAQVKAQTQTQVKVKPKTKGTKK